MKKEVTDLRRAEVVSKEAEAQREKNFHDKYKKDIKHIAWRIETDCENGKRWTEFYGDELNTHLINYLETMGYTVVYMNRGSWYCVAFDKETAKEMINEERKYRLKLLLKSYGIRFLGGMSLFCMWYIIICKLEPMFLQICSTPLGILASKTLFEMIIKGHKYGER